MENIQFLTLGSIFLTIGLIGFLTDNIFLGFLMLTLALIFFVRQHLLNTMKKEKEEDQKDGVINDEQ